MTSVTTLPDTVWWPPLEPAQPPSLAPSTVRRENHRDVLQRSRLWVDTECKNNERIGVSEDQDPDPESGGLSDFSCLPDSAGLLLPAGGFRVVLAEHLPEELVVGLAAALLVSDQFPRLAGHRDSGVGLPPRFRHGQRC